MILIVLLTMDGDVTSESLTIVKTLTKWLLFCILRIYKLSPELKKTFREAERLQEKIIKLKTHLKLNKTCLIYIYMRKNQLGYHMHFPLILNIIY